MSDTLLPEVNSSALQKGKIEQLSQEIRETYLANDFPWVVGYSGGKDSTTVLQLVWYALSALPADQRKKPVYVLSSDTLVETPMIVNYIDTTLQRINETAKRENLLFEARKVVPRTTDTFWVNIIGRGYPAPYSNFRWCTDRMKIQPANRFILDCVAKYGEVVLVMGVRRAESANRAKTMSAHVRKGKHLSYHHELRGALVYTPIEDWQVKDVWQYLLEWPSPWGNDNRDLAALYQTAQSGECPLVIDKTTPSCGNSRFGCWTCTVVTKDKALEGMIDSGEEWMVPLLEFRDFLVSTQDPDKKADLREHKRRNGRVEERDGHFVWGPFQPWFRKELLKRLLETQEQIQQHGPDPTMVLITDEELHEIRRLWRTEMHDWEDSLPKIYPQVTGKRLPGIGTGRDPFTEREKKVLEHLASTKEVPAELVLKLIDLERRMYGMQRRTAIQGKIDSVLAEDWRSREEVLQNAVTLQQRPTSTPPVVSVVE
jgi:DNA sulfur modification protein DndC